MGCSCDGGFEQEGDSQSTADAQRGQPTPCFAPAHFENETDGDSRAGGSDRVTERDCPTVHVDAGQFQIELALTGRDLGGKGFVELCQMDALQSQPGFG